MKMRSIFQKKPENPYSQSGLLFSSAIGYKGKKLTDYLGQIRATIVKRSNGKLSAVNRLKPKKSRD